MISFPCRCGHPFEVDEDQAGGLIQCPDCSRLNDIPLLSEIDSLRRDGTYALDDGPVQEAPDRMDQLNRAFGMDRQDDYGIDIDLRERAREPRPMRVEPIDRPAPKYDPVTGELIQPLELETEERFQRTEPPDFRGYQTSLGYARTAHADNTSPFGIFISALMPMNLVAMAFVLATHLVAGFLVTMLPLLGLLMFFLLYAIIIGHYFKVIEAMAVDELDEFPRMLGNISIGEDIFYPLFKAIFSFALAYGPAAAIEIMMLGMVKDAASPWADTAASVVNISAVLVATALFPAIALTVMTSGSIHNLRPDRVVGMALRGGISYVLAVVCWVLGMAAYGLRTAQTDQWPALVHLQGTWAETGARFFLLLAAIYFMHMFGWQLGLAYQKHHDRFPWVLQRHISSRQDR